MNTRTRTPIEIARETLLRLTERRMDPTPENYAEMYQRVAGGFSPAPSMREAFKKSPEEEMKEMFANTLGTMANKIARENSSDPLIPLLRTFDMALKAPGWTAFQKTCNALLKPPAVNQSNDHLPWPGLIGRLIAQYNFQHPSITLALKYDALAKALNAPDTVTAYKQLEQLVQEWELEAAVASEGAFTLPKTSSGRLSRTISNEIRGLFSDYLHAMAERYETYALPVAEQARAIAKKVMTVENFTQCEELKKSVEDFIFKSALYADDQIEIQGVLIKLLETMFNGFSEWMGDDPKLREKLEETRSAIQPPIQLPKLEHAAHKLIDLVIRQIERKAQITSAQNEMKTLMSRFVGYLGEMTTAGGEYAMSMTELAEKLEKTDDPDKLPAVFSEILKRTNQARINFIQRTDDLRAMRREIEESDERIYRIQKEMEKAVEKADDETVATVLSARGVDSRLAFYIKKAKRRRSPLCIAMLYVNNFNAVIDEWGEQGGDETLKRLVKIIRSHLQFEEMVSRYSDEVFLLIFPSTALEEAKDRAIVLQRMLTKDFFLHQTDRVLVTFSSGIADWVKSDTEQSLVERALQAMQAATQLGKNQVVAVAHPTES